jgi:hypothetical protein
MKVTRRAHANQVEKSKPAAKKEKVETKAARSESFDGKAKANHARKLDPGQAAHTPVPQRDVHSTPALMREVVNGGKLHRVDGPPKGLQGEGVDIGPEPEWRGAGTMTERRAFEHEGKVFVRATVWETPGKVWFELGPTPPPPPPPKPDPGLALKARVDGAKLAKLVGPPKGIKGDGVAIGPGGYVGNDFLSARQAFEVGDRTFVRATVWEKPGSTWFEAK